MRPYCPDHGALYTEPGTCQQCEDELNDLEAEFTALLGWDDPEDPGDDE